jgi:hypothetical protein
MAKPKGGTLAALWEVSDRERQEFFEHIQKRSPAVPAHITGIPDMGAPDMGTPPNEQDPGPPVNRGIACVPVSGTPETGTPDTGPPDIEQVPPRRPNVKQDLFGKLTGTPAQSTPITGIPAPGAAPSSLNTRSYPPFVSFTGTPEPGLPLSGVPVSGPQPAPVRKIRRAVQVQDGHSLGEHLVLTTLWKDSAAVPVGPSTKRITIGYRTLSEKCRLTVNNCKANLRSLQQKLAIEAVVAPSNSHATTYLVYDFAEIMRRREAVGMTHVIRSKGCLFVNPGNGPTHTRCTSSRCTPCPRIGYTDPSFRCTWNGQNGYTRFGRAYKE